tara:strand:+ start:108 stop:257 length:150 start_codon:yes stop_codon:yes gene_type:complete
MKFNKYLGKNALALVVIAQLFVIIGMLNQKASFVCRPNPMSGLLYCHEK